MIAYYDLYYFHNTGKLITFVQLQNPKKMNINLTAIIKSTEGNAEAMKSLLLQLLAESRKESACIQYDLHQDQENKNVFIFHEIWESQEGLDQHNAQPHIKQFVTDSASIIDGPASIHKIQKVA